MAKAKKLPSGSWRCLVYDYTDDTGKRHYRSFTSDDPSPRGKREAEFLAAQYATDKKMHAQNTSNIRFKDALDQYIDTKRNVLSQSTIRGYAALKNSYGFLLDMNIKDITQKDVQKWANQFSLDRSPKTVRNAHGLLSAVLYSNNIAPLKTTLPQNTIPKYHVPTDGEVSKVIQYFLSQNDKDMVNAVYLAAYGTLRRSEICGLTSEDISGNTIHVHSALVKDDDHHFTQKKTTKTISSDRYIEFPQFVIDSLPKSGRLVSLCPDVISNRFRRAVYKLELPRFRFHDLRHYSASVMHAIGIPDVYIMERGGWSSDTVLKRIYRGSMEDYKKQFVDKTNKHFEAMQHEIQHENIKA